MAKGTSTQTQQSTTQPWAPAQPALQGILSGIQSQMGSYQPNAAENGALSTLVQNANTQPNWGTTANDLTKSYLGGDPTGLVNPAYNTLKGQLLPYASGDNLDPTKAPGMANVLSTIRNDVSNNINSQFAGAGRDLSGLNVQNVSRGIAQGEAVPLLNQYNSNVNNQLGAAGSLFNAAGTTANSITGNQAAGLNLANIAPQLANAPAMSILNAEAGVRGLPLQNLGMLENLTIPIAGLGTQSQGSGSYTMSPLQQMAMGSGALFGNKGIFGGLFG